MTKALSSIFIGAVVGFGVVTAVGVGARAKVDNGLMTNVPGFGNSRVETVSFCLSDVDVVKFQDLVTDSQVEGFAACLRENT